MNTSEIKHETATEGLIFVRKAKRIIYIERFHSLIKNRKLIDLLKYMRDNIT